VRCVEGNAGLQALWLARTAATILFYTHLKATVLAPFKQLSARRSSAAEANGSAPRLLSCIAPALFLCLANVATFVLGAVALRKSANAVLVRWLCYDLS
jgi:hypothetical protein